jgi:flagellar basal-body rod modification protein FlgD
MSDSTSLNTITVDGVTYDAAKYAADKAATAAKDNSALGKDAFLQLLVTQMQYQDPLNPQDNGEYLAQLAQFSALEQMTNVSDGLSNVSALVSNIDTSVLVGQLSHMIGQDLQWNESTSYTDEEGNVKMSSVKHEGIVTGVSISDGSPTIIAEDNGHTYQVKIADITRIGAGKSEGSDSSANG